MCDGCGMTFTSVTTMEKHKAEVDHEKSTCAVCGMTFEFFQMIKYKNHMMYAHNPEKREEFRRKFTCKYCDKTMSNLTTLKIHIDSIHEKKEEYKCDQCDYKTFNKNNINNHKNHVHEKKFNFPCKFCDMKFRANRDRVKHMKSAHNVAE